MFRWYDFIYVLDTLFLFIYISKNSNKLIYKKTYIKTPIGLLLCILTLTLAEIDRPQLLTRSFDNNYLVKYLGLSGFTMKNINDYNQLKMLRADATENDLADVENFTNKNISNKVNQYTGIAKDKNVVYIHLESLQQFIIDYKLKDENGKEHEVTPYLNSIFHSNDTLAFNNAFHQVSQGKTSDAEFMIENSLFGSESGSAMVKFGTDNTFHSAPTILKDFGYTSQVFHGNTDTFWNRNNAYKSFGYDNFYSLKTYDNQEVINYGLKDDVFFQESLEKYLNIDGKK
ncbi:LTA synthase family protein, partial [Sutterella wadsworthensis]|uniref:LTA synthase family protein n=1 Tax=Sutterella wadsworthensis TaxID=40545 RepID=UPI0032C0734F